MTAASASVFRHLIIVSSVTSTLSAMSTEIYMANTVPPELRGRASGWSQAGNLGGAGLGGGSDCSSPSTSALVGVRGGPRRRVLRLLGGDALPAAASNKNSDVELRCSELQGSRHRRLGGGAIAARLSGACHHGAADRLRRRTVVGDCNGMERGWRLVALVNGVAGGVASMVGAMLAGVICDRMDVKRAYCLFGILVGLSAVAMIFAPRTPTVFAVGVLGYQLMVGMAYTGYAAIVLEAIGKKSAATNWNLMAALSNAPIAVMSMFDGWTHDRFGTNCDAVRRASSCLRLPFWRAGAVCSQLSDLSTRRNSR